MKNLFWKIMAILTLLFAVFVAGLWIWENQWHYETFDRIFLVVKINKITGKKYRLNLAEGIDAEWHRFGRLGRWEEVVQK